MPGSNSAIRLLFIKETQIGTAIEKLGGSYYFAASYLHNCVVYVRCGFMSVCLRTPRTTWKRIFFIMQFSIKIEARINCSS